MRGPSFASRSLLLRAGAFFCEPEPSLASPEPLFMHFRASSYKLMHQILILSLDTNDLITIRQTVLNH